jgi:CRP/FNR family transcriptional regulator
MHPLSYEEFITAFPAFRNSPVELSREILSTASYRIFPAGMLLYAEGDTCSAIAFLLSGELRVYKAGEGGREITLYEIRGGETCILNASCILAGTRYPAHAVSVEEGAMLLIPAGDFRRLMDVYDDMRRFVFDIMSRRLALVMALVEEVAFGKMDRRLTDYLAEKAKDGVLLSSHQKIADDLGTSREVVSRLLKELERRRAVTLARNRITLISS